jgi:hypothetical protein
MLTFCLCTFGSSDGLPECFPMFDWILGGHARYLLADKLRASGLERTEVRGSRARNVAYLDEGFLRIPLA